MPKFVLARVRKTNKEDYENRLINAESVEALWRPADGRGTVLRMNSGEEMFVHPADAFVIEQEGSIEQEDEEPEQES